MAVVIPGRRWRRGRGSRREGSPSRAQPVLWGGKWVGLAGSGLVRLGNEPQERFEVLAEADQVDDLQRVRHQPENDVVRSGPGIAEIGNGRLVGKQPSARQRMWQGAGGHGLNTRGQLVAIGQRPLLPRAPKDRARPLARRVPEPVSCACRHPARLGAGTGDGAALSHRLRACDRPASRHCCEGRRLGSLQAGKKDAGRLAFPHPCGLLLRRRGGGLRGGRGRMFKTLGVSIS
jgi:hypothetical protein